MRKTCWRNRFGQVCCDQYCLMLLFLLSFMASLVRNKEKLLVQKKSYPFTTGSLSVLNGLSYPTVSKI